MNSNLRYLKPLVEQILRNPFNHSWSVQGFGMLRTYFGPQAEPKRFRLNLWDKRFAVPGVSTIHDHPWHFGSIVIAGMFVNVRYELTEEEYYSTHFYTTIKTGEGGGMTKTPTKHCVLVPSAPELYKPGDEYRQNADEIHQTIYSDGTVTLNERARVGDGEHARVFWTAGTDWVDAEPREADAKEVGLAVDTALREWF
jgi:hypothetical protein